VELVAACGAALDAVDARDGYGEAKTAQTCAAMGSGVVR